MSVKAGEALRALKNTSFKSSKNVYWATAKEADDQLWLVVLPTTHEAVKEFRARIARGVVAPDNPWVAEFGDVHEEWVRLFERKAHDAATRGDKSRAGVDTKCGGSRRRTWCRSP